MNEVPGRVLLDERTWDWSLFREPNGDLLLSVVCGTVGLFETDVILDAEQRAAYETEGIAAIERLAQAISYSPRKYRHARTQPESG